MVELRNKGYVPVAWTYRWAAEDPFMPYDSLRERGLRSRTFVELAHDSVVYVFAMRRTNKAEANEFWRLVDDYARVHGINRGFIRAARAWLGEEVWDA